MKKLLFLALAGFVFSCNTANDEADSTDKMATNDADTGAYSYPYTLDHPNDWSWGDKRHIQTVLSSLKAFEEGNIDAAVADFADTVRVEFNEYEATLPKDSLKAFFERERASMQNLKIVMDDWESVISKDKSYEYVSLWYKQIWTDQNGKIDSMQVMDDLRLKDGKIVLLNEKIRRYGKK